ncbi:MAG: hypothetical protein JNJ49_08990 [Bdellovibrionaceae bacterium]|nr:hypothetical protein [Pseudobdellovibrionaceae bacterium]
MRQVMLALGLMASSGFGLSAHAAPICATTASQIETSNSPLLKDMLKLLRNNKAPGLANKSRGSFLRADVSNKLVLAYHSTTEGFLGTEFEYRDGSLEVCDNDGKLVLKSQAFGSRDLEVTLSGECFRIEHAMARMMPDASTFCPGTMPAPIRVAMDNAPSTPAKTRAQLANQ